MDSAALESSVKKPLVCASDKEEANTRHSGMFVAGKMRMPMPKL